jgi:hypothetical protein
VRFSVSELNMKLSAGLTGVILIIPAICTCRYGSYPLRGKHCHEMALRILLACIEVRLEIVFLCPHIYS